jgi:DNA-binding CsgD family transcriptional regulator
VTSGYIPGAARGMALSEMIRLNGLDATVHTLKTSVVEFFFTEAGHDARDKCFETTLEALIELIGDCARKRPAKSKVHKTRLNGERQEWCCQFCGSLPELTSFARGSDAPKADYPDAKLRLSSRYCKHHRPQLPNGAWNSKYRRAKRSFAQFDLELTRLSEGYVWLAGPQVLSGNQLEGMSDSQLVDSYIHHYLAGRNLRRRSSILELAELAELSNHARRMVDAKLSDRKKQILMLQLYGLNQSEIARKLGIKRQAVSKALASIPTKFHLKIA